MGLQGLYGFVNNKNPDLLSDYRLRDTKLVIDGLGLLRQLYARLESRYGGEYVEYRKKCSLFFDNLQQCDITAYVVFDGAWDMDDKKYNTHLSRHQNTLCIAKAVSEDRGRDRRRMLIPVFALNILQDVANKRKEVFVVTAEFEADIDIAALANHFQCPVLANDNDFFIYPLRTGYIVLDKLRWASVETQIKQEGSINRQRSHYLGCTIFAAQDELCKRLGIKKRSLPLFATIRGNDYLNMDTLKPFHNSIKLPFGSNALSVLGDWMKERSEKMNDDTILEEVLDILKLSEENRNEVETLAKQSIGVYSNTSKSHLHDFFTEEACAPQIATSTANTSTASTEMPLEVPLSATTLSPTQTTDEFAKLGLPLYVVEHLRSGNLHSMWVNVFVRGENMCVKQVQDFSQCSANNISEDLRAVIYGILLGNGKFKSVKEYDRESESSKASQKNVEIRKELSHYGRLPSLADVGKLSREEQKSLILASLGQTDSAFQFEDQLQLPMAVTKYWFQRSSCSQYIARGLVIGFLLYSDDDMLKTCSDHLKQLPQPALNVLHAFSQWQSCMLYANDLNVLLNSPLPEYDISKLFSGQKNHQLVEFAHDTDAFGKILDDFPSFKDKYMQLLNYIKK